MVALLFLDSDMVWYGKLIWIVGTLPGFPFVDYIIKKVEWWLDPIQRMAVAIRKGNLEKASLMRQKAYDRYQSDKELWAASGRLGSAPVNVPAWLEEEFLELRRKTTS